MPRLAANLSYLFTERPFLDRFEAAARWGFRAVEHQFPYTEAPESAIRKRLHAHDLQVVLFNLPPGNEGERGLGGLPGREAEFREGLDLALPLGWATAAILGELGIDNHEITRLHDMGVTRPIGHGLPS